MYACGPIVSSSAALELCHMSHRFNPPEVNDASPVAPEEDKREFFTDTFIVKCTVGSPSTRGWLDHIKEPPPHQNPHALKQDPPRGFHAFYLAN